MGSDNLFGLVAKNIDVIAGPLVALVYPLYASIKAIETRSLADDQQWLTYWVIYSLITLFELTFAKLLELFPIWPYAKLIATCCQPDDILTAAEKYIEENGTEAFERLISRADRESRYRNNYMIFDDDYRY
ncbi:hypothetical protein F0562_033761 [Nyssa sinensis]|uniref:HVA22-like protein n=1 Tax=Nyssa sinensis TaxID=561372 RepID=A0A5J5AFT1_9ASTE|nr:hypothetical protein F0562_033761 [Nyssa sinensis]